MGHVLKPIVVALAVAALLGGATSDEILATERGAALGVVAANSTSIVSSAIATGIADIRNEEDPEEIELSCGEGTEIECDFDDGEIAMPRLLIQSDDDTHWTLQGTSGGSAHDNTTWGCYGEATAPSSRVSHVDPTPSGSYYSGHIMGSSTTSCSSHSGS